MTFVPSVVQTVAGVGEVDFMYLSDNTSGNTTVQIIPSFTASDVVANYMTFNYGASHIACSTCVHMLYSAT